MGRKALHKIPHRREYGDYQTPEHFAAAVCQLLKATLPSPPFHIIEPTCGTESFLKSCLLLNPVQVTGIEINEACCDLCRATLSDARVRIINADIFSFDLASLTQQPEQDRHTSNGKEQRQPENRHILILGNPPWVTQDTLTSLNADNTPL